MTTRPKEPSVAAETVVGAESETEPTGSVVLSLDALGVDFRAADFPTRFIDFCEANDDYEMEVNETGELVILPMVGFRGNRQETELNAELTIFRRTNGGINASQTSRFRLASGAIRGPDAAWITQERYDAATVEERETVFPGAPDFVVEIRSRTDNLAPLQRKMQLWMDGGARLGWLIDPTTRRVYVYRAGQPEPEVLEDPETLDGEGVLPGFSFQVRRYIFDMQ
jgi:Uma2 family endonuclease